MKISVYRVNWRDNRYTDKSPTAALVGAPSGSNNGVLAGILQQHFPGVSIEVESALEIQQDLLLAIPTDTSADDDHTHEGEGNQKGWSNADIKPGDIVTTADGSQYVAGEPV